MSGIEPVQKQFGRTAAAYVDSPNHAKGEDLDRIVALAAEHGGECVVDVGTGVGHTLRRVAPHFRGAVGVDAPREILEAGGGLLAGAGITNAVLVQAAAGAGRRGPAPAGDSTAGRGRGVPDRGYHVRGAQAHPRRSRVTFDDLPTLRAVPTVTAAQMAEVDRITAQDLHIPVEILMEDASRQIAVAARAFLGGSVSGKRIVGLVGTGNNGGDTAGALRHLIGWGARVAAEVAAPQERAHESPRVQLGRLPLGTASPGAGVPYASHGGPRDPGARLHLDGLLGYSARGAPRGTVAMLIDAASASTRRILAIDLPSGIDPDS